MLSNTSLDINSDIGVTDHINTMIDQKENKIENF